MINRYSFKSGRLSEEFLDHGLMMSLLHPLNTAGHLVSNLDAGLLHLLQLLQDCLCVTTLEGIV